jgi:hypothetical protein
LWNQGTFEANADVDSLNSKKVMAIKRIMTLCVPEVQPEVQPEVRLKKNESFRLEPEVIVMRF